MNALSLRIDVRKNFGTRTTLSQFDTTMFGLLTLPTIQNVLSVQTEKVTKHFN